VSIDNLGNLYTSTDGKTWTRNTAFLPDSSYSKIATEGGKHVTVSTLLTTGDQIKYSTDGTNWNNATQVPSGYVFIDVAAGKNVFIAIARSLTDSTKVYAMVSQNMTRWTLSDYIYSGSGVQFTAINYGHNMFVVGTSSSTVPPYRTFTTDGSI
jgi:sucrose-6-phosphate hydrolase SacC (GH32 family)